MKCGVATLELRLVLRDSRRKACEILGSVHLAREVGDEPLADFVRRWAISSTRSRLEQCPGPANRSRTELGLA